MKLPVQPQPEAKLRDRYTKALLPIYDAREFMEPDPPTAPSSKREHVFDTLDGLRLIVSRERLPDGQVVTHVSGSFHERCSEELQKIRKALSLDDAQDFMVRRWREIAQDHRSPVEFVGLTVPKGIPHWWVRTVH